MQKLILVVLAALCAGCFARPATQQDSNNNVSSTIPVGVPFNEEIVVESSLNIRSKNQNRQKRQFGMPAYGQSNALANANSWGQYQNPQGFGAGSGIAGAQAFRSQGPGGGFGATAANTGTQSLNCQYTGGCTGSAGMSGSQTYDLPGGRHVNLAYGSGFTNDGRNPAVSNSNSLTFT